MSELVADPLGRFVQPEVEKRYIQYMQDHHGEIDIPRLCETMHNFGYRQAVAAMIAFGDIMPQLGRIENKIAQIRQMLEEVTREVE